MNYQITSRFLQQESFRNRGHSGIDFAMPNGTPLRSIQDGVIEKVTHYKDNIGNGVLVRWNDGKVAIYGHMSKTSVNVGDKVHAGDLLGYSGNSGHVVGANGGYHLHFGLKNAEGNFINPSAYIEDIQNMNVKEFVQHIPKPYIPNDVVEPTQLKFSFFDYMKQHMDMIGNSLPDIKVNLISFFHLTDYSPFVQLLKNLVKLLFIHF
ncbi:M23 family metallopeptidase [Bacillus xiapuensis]|uniref:M23 family metallopeptidase n=1 Tax=Bacillus xiapuensis TaxID=2014075 RepID=A0ABU6N7V2_9BACI|nr:M23 family metallopeptidase [Bacillus xiapuensis]